MLHRTPCTATKLAETPVSMPTPDTACAAKYCCVARSFANLMLRIGLQSGGLVLRTAGLLTMDFTCTPSGALTFSPPLMGVVPFKPPGLLSLPSVSTLSAYGSEPSMPVLRLASPSSSWYEHVAVCFQSEVQSFSPASLACTWDQLHYARRAITDFHA